jgi:hypothetical protein
MDTFETHPVKDEHKHITCAKYPDLFDYHLGISGEGPHAYNWQDKPHRLVYDLTRIAAEHRDTIQQQAERIRELEAREIALKDSKRLQERDSSDRINTLTQQLAEVVEYATKLRAALGDIQNFYHKPVEVWQWSGDALKLPLPDVMQEIK